MKKVLTKWSPESFKDAQIKNKTSHGFLAILVSEKLGEDYSTVIVEEGMTEEIAIRNLKARFSSVGIYALVNRTIHLQSREKRFRAIVSLTIQMTELKLME